MRCNFVALLTSLLVAGSAPAQSSNQVAPRQIAIRAGKLIDGKSEKLVENAVIVIEGDKIVSVTPGGTVPAGAEVIDLSKATVLPGFMDVHTHVLLQGDITNEEYDAQLLKESIPYRRFSPRGMPTLPCRTDSPRFATSKPKARCTRTWT